MGLTIISWCPGSPCDACCQLETFDDGGGSYPYVNNPFIHYTGPPVAGSGQIEVFCNEPGAWHFGLGVSYMQGKWGFQAACQYVGTPVPINAGSAPTTNAYLYFLVDQYPSGSAEAKAGLGGPPCLEVPLSGTPIIGQSTTKYIGSYHEFDGLLYPYQNTTDALLPFEGDFLEMGGIIMDQKLKACLDSNFKYSGPDFDHSAYLDQWESTPNRYAGMMPYYGDRTGPEMAYPYPIIDINGTQTIDALYVYQALFAIPWNQDDIAPSNQTLITWERSLGTAMWTVPPPTTSFNPTYWIYDYPYFDNNYPNPAGGYGAEIYPISHYYDIPCDTYQMGGVVYYNITFFSQAIAA